MRRFFILMLLFFLIFVVYETKTVSANGMDFSNCNINITNAMMPYMINQSNKVYCLNGSASISGTNATLFTTGVHNSTLDCMGYSIEGDSSDDTFGVYMGNGTSNNTVRNCNITMFQYNVYLDFTSNNRVYNITTYERNGIWLYNSSGNVFVGISSKIGSDGVFLDHSFNNSFTNVNSSINRNGFWLTESYNNTIRDSFASWNQYSGVYTEFSNDTILRNVTSYNNDVGFFFDISNNVTMEDCNSTSTMSPYNGSYMWHSGYGPNLDNNMSRYFNLTEVNNATLTFWHWYNTEWGGDGGRLEFFNETSGEWEVLYPEGDYYPPGDSVVDSLGGEGYNDFSRFWKKATFNLTELAGTYVEIRFIFKTDTYVNYRNWFIDDINISEIGFFDGTEGEILWNSSGFSVVESYTIQSYGIYMQGAGNGPVFENSGYGKISFQEPVNLSGGIDSSNINISFNRIEVNSTALPELNMPATLTLYDLTFSDPRILKDGSVCTDCNEVSYSGGDLVFNVTSFSVYSAEETPTGTPGTQTVIGGGGVSTYGCEYLFNFTYPDSMSIKINESEQYQIFIKNAGTCSLNISVAFSGIPNGWLTMDTAPRVLYQNRNMTLDLMIMPLSEGEYNITWMMRGSVNKNYTTRLTVLENVLECPQCPQPTEWSLCSDGKQGRTVYSCDESTGYSCRVYRELQDCTRIEEGKVDVNKRMFYEQYLLIAVASVAIVVILYLKFKPVKSRKV